jgi:tripartite-type tricarboxylate transporter receptor subunit TctC
VRLTKHADNRDLTCEAFETSTEHASPTTRQVELRTRRDLVKGLAGFAALHFACAGFPDVRAETEFYRGKTIKIVVAAAPGAAYDFVARALADSIGRHIPGNPGVLVQNMYGAAGLAVMNSLYNNQPRDGTVIGLPLSGILLEPRLKLMARQGGTIGFDLGKMSFVGSPTQQPQILWVWHKTPLQSVADLRKRKARMGATSFSADNYILPTLSNAFLGTDLQIISGYSAVADIFLAGERGELDGGTCNYSSLAAKADWMRDKDARILLQFGSERATYMPNVPTAAEMAEDDIGRQALQIYAVKYKAAYPFMMPPDVPPDRVAAIRAAFMDTMKDPQFITEAKKLGFDVDPLPGEEIEKLVAQISAAPEQAFDRLKKLLG